MAPAPVASFLACLVSGLGLWQGQRLFVTPLAETPIAKTSIAEEPLKLLKAIAEEPLKLLKANLGVVAEEPLKLVKANFELLKTNLGVVAEETLKLLKANFKLLKANLGDLGVVCLLGALIAATALLSVLLFARVTRKKGRDVELKRELGKHTAGDGHVDGDGDVRPRKHIAGDEQVWYKVWYVARLVALLVGLLVASEAVSRAIWQFFTNGDSSSEGSE